MGLFDNIRAEILEEFNSYIGDTEMDIKYYSNNTFNSRAEKISKPKDEDFIFRLEIKRWGYAPICPSCGCEKCYTIIRGNRYRCSNRLECAKDFNVLSGTILQNTKISLNIWHDIIVDYRTKRHFSTRSFALKNNITQKTSWFMLHKIKTSPLIGEHEISPMQILLTPNPFTYNTYNRTKLTTKEFTQKALSNLEKIYTNSLPTYELAAQLLTILQTHFEGKQNLLAEELGFSKSNLSRYLNGERKINKKNYIIINDFIKKKVISGYSYIQGN